MLAPPDYLGEISDAHLGHSSALFSFSAPPLQAHTPFFHAGMSNYVSDIIGSLKFIHAIKYLPINDY